MGISFSALLFFPFLMVMAIGRPVSAADCTAKGIRLHGRVKEVTAFPDLRVQKVSAFPDLRVKLVKAFPDRCGEWQMVDAFPDFTIQFVNSFPDITVRFVEAFPGKPQ
ncbi:MAG: hypothetical protein LBE84_12595 [Planctomycetota bacterium]|jgi:hypothetical protein|nr:hypothetical protein [Planctomycetota bacterium]